MEVLYTKIHNQVRKWRDAHYPSATNEIAQILNFQFIDEEKTTLRYLRKPQFEAIETYLYLRFIEDTKHSIDLYKAYYPAPNDLLNVLGINLEQDDLVNILANGGIEQLFEKIKTDTVFVKKYKLENIRESLSLSYPSYILSLVMGAGKTILIGTIIFIEFALSLKTNNDQFLKNALVFAPGKTILGSLKEISVIDIEQILPPQLVNLLQSNLKITYTQDGQKTIPIIHSSNYNIIITNIEKIRLFSKKIKKGLFNQHKKYDSGEKENIANQRLQALASLPNLGIFSDEAHNTYGQDLDKSIKKVRQTIDYLAAETDLKVVINTTGTPYFKKKILKDVVFWYGLLEGIKENILKDIRGNNIYSYAEVRDKQFITNVLDDFFSTYQNIKIEGGYKSKIAIYFPQIEYVKKIRPFIEKKISEYGLGPDAVLEVNSKSNNEVKDIFINRINNPNLSYRVFLLVGMGKEGWNCPSLFACCLARDLGNSNNFVLQAATRCLRQIANNTTHARIYLSQKNTQILDTQLQDNYGEDLSTIKNQQNKFIQQKITLIKYDDELPQLKITRKIKQYIKKEATIKNIIIKNPPAQQTSAKLIKYDFSKINQAKLVEKQIANLRQQYQQTVSVFMAAQELAALYCVDYFVVFGQLKQHFPHGLLTTDELIAIKRQLEEQVDNYHVKEIEVDELLTIIKKQGFNEEIDEQGIKVYTTNILINKDKLNDLLRTKAKYADTKDISFHYDPYKFDSKLEATLFEFVLECTQENSANIEHFLFIGGITDINKTDLVFEYQDKDGVYRNYTPDFLMIKKNGEMIFLETKGKHLEENFKIKQAYFKAHLKDNFKYKLMVSENENLSIEDKQWIKDEAR